MRKRTCLACLAAVLLMGAASLTYRTCRKSGSTVHSILPPTVQLHEGDVVFRRGGGMTSQAVLLADKNGYYSHCGIVVDSAGCMLIVHAVPGEPDYEGDPDRVKADRPATFFSSVYANAGEVCRTDNDTIARTAARTAWEIYRRGVLFDHDYNSNDTTLLYCTELVHLVYSEAGCTLCGDPTHRFDLPGLHCVCWLPSDLHASAHLRSIAKF